MLSTHKYQGDVMNRTPFFHLTHTFIFLREAWEDGILSNVIVKMATKICKELDNYGVHQECEFILQTKMAEPYTNQTCVTVYDRPYRCNRKKVAQALYLRLFDHYRSRRDFGSKPTNAGNILYPLMIFQKECWKRTL